MSNSQKPIKHRWSESERISLAILFLFYSNPPAELFSIWNKLYDHVLKSEGFQTGLPAGRLIAQTCSLRNSGVGSAVWERVMRTPLEQARDFYQSERNLIEATAQVLGLVLYLKVYNTLEEPNLQINVANALSKKPLYARAEDWCITSLSSFLTDDEEEEEVLHETPSKRSKNLHHAAKVESSQRKIIAKPCLAENTSDVSDSSEDETIYLEPKLIVEYDIDGNHAPKKRPQLLFRAYNPEHEFTARRFQHSSEEIPRPPPLSTKAFKDEVIPHLMINETYDSPFMSWAQNPAVALRHVKKDRDATFQLAVFHFNDLEEDAKDRFGKRSGPYLVRDLCRRHQLGDLPKQYKGYGEWLLWGDIECEPVVIFENSKALELLDIMKSVKKVNKVAGTKIGKFLRPFDLDIEDTHLIARNLVNGYKIAGYQTNYEKTKFRRFLKAVRRAAGKGQLGQDHVTLRSSRRRSRWSSTPERSSIRDEHEMEDYDDSSMNDNMDDFEWSSEDEPQGDSTQTTQTSFSTDTGQILPGISDAAAYFHSVSPDHLAGGQETWDMVNNKTFYFHHETILTSEAGFPPSSKQPKSITGHLAVQSSMLTNNPTTPAPAPANLANNSPPLIPLTPTEIIHGPEPVHDDHLSRTTQSIAEAISGPLQSTLMMSLKNRDIIDLTEDNDVEEPSNRLIGTEEDLIIIASTTRGHTQHRALSIRSKSISVIPRNRWKQLFGTQ